MGDFILDFRDKNRISSKDAHTLQFYGDMEIECIEHNKFSLVLSSSEATDIWKPFTIKDEDIHVALCGKIALDAEQWKQTGAFEKSESAACKGIAETYKASGINGLVHYLNGNYVVIIYDGRINTLYLITDRWGMMPCFGTGSKGKIFSSHPDILARLVSSGTELDFTSFTEFFVTGKLSWPYTYYKNIQSLEYGAVYEFDMSNTSSIHKGPKKYFEFTFAVDQKMSEWDLAEELASAFKQAVRRRTLPLFGKVAFSLSGGLDSRTLLCATRDKRNVCAFSFFDEENLEYSTAKAIAKEAEVEFFPLKRNFEHYGDFAEDGIRISGGMGSLGNNHFLGFRNMYNKLGFNNVLTGFYCDYMFKALVLDYTETPMTRKEIFTPFKYENYQKHIWFDSQFTGEVKARLHSLFPDHLINQESERVRQIIAHNRFYPLCYEPDNLETTIPQRVMNFYLPTIDNSILDVYQKIKPSYKLNKSIFTKTVRLVCGKKICRIINTNTGVKVGASRISTMMSRYTNALRRKLAKGKSYSEGSWPNWHYYRRNSKKIASLMHMKKNETKDVLINVLGKEEMKYLYDNYKTVHIKKFLRFFTLKTWLDINM